MTTCEYVKKFGIPKVRNTNILEDKACPKCGSRGGFRIQMSVFGDVTDDGSDADGDHEWDSNSQCYCHHCNHHDVLEAFTVEGLDTEREEDPHG
jgi:hypothetical protein